MPCRHTLRDHLIVRRAPVHQGAFHLELLATGDGDVLAGGEQQAALLYRRDVKAVHRVAAMDAHQLPGQQLHTLASSILTVVVWSRKYSTVSLARASA